MGAIKKERIVKAKRKLELSVNPNDSFYNKNEDYLIKVELNEKGWVSISLAGNGKNKIVYSNKEEYLLHWEELEEKKSTDQKGFILEIEYNNEIPSLKIANNGVPYSVIITYLEIAKTQHIQQLLNSTAKPK